MEDKGKLFLTEEHQLTNVEETELENRYLAATSVIIISGKNYQRMLKLAGESVMKNIVFT